MFHSFKKFLRISENKSDLSLPSEGPSICFNKHFRIKLCQINCLEDTFSVMYHSIQFHVWNFKVALLNDSANFPGSKIFSRSQVLFNSLDTCFTFSKIPMHFLARSDFWRTLFVRTHTLTYIYDFPTGKYNYSRICRKMSDECLLLHRKNNIYISFKCLATALINAQFKVLINHIFIISDPHFISHVNRIGDAPFSINIS